MAKHYFELADDYEDASSKIALCESNIVELKKSRLYFEAEQKKNRIRELKNQFNMLCKEVNNVKREYEKARQESGLPGKTQLLEALEASEFTGRTEINRTTDAATLSKEEEIEAYGKRIMIIEKSLVDMKKGIKDIHSNLWALYAKRASDLNKEIDEISKEKPSMILPVMIGLLIDFIVVSYVAKQKPPESVGQFIFGLVAYGIVIVPVGAFVSAVIIGVIKGGRDRVDALQKELDAAKTKAEQYHSKTTEQK